MVSLTTLLALATTALSAPHNAPRQMAIPENWAWSVENWVAGCGRTGCSYNFNVTVPTVEGQIGGVKAYCFGGEAYFRDCQILEGVNNGVAAKWMDYRPGTGEGPKQVAISFVKASYEGSPAYNFTGINSTTYNDFVAPAINFTLVPTEVFGTA